MAFKRRCVRGMTAAALVVVAIAPGPEAAQQFRAGVALVRLPIVVTARDGLLVRGLTAKSFEVLEDGVPQTIVAFAEGAPREDVPLHLGLLLDASASMENDFKAAANAAIKFVQAAEEAADVTLVDFDSSIRVGRFEPPSYERLFERIRSPQPQGWTALYDAIVAYVRGASARDGQHVLLVYTDGGDSVSGVNYSQLLDLLRSTSVTVYSVGYLENRLSRERVENEMRLSAIAHETGGAAFFPSTVRDLTTAYARILDELGSRYTLGYVSTNGRQDGKMRKVQVRVTSAEHRSVKIRTRPGYIAR